MNDVLEAPHQSSAAPLVDRVHLARYTMEDRDLEHEVLALFRSHSRVQIEQLQHAVGDATAWHAATHGLKGSARGIGAWSLGDAAEAAERDQAASSQTHRKHLSILTECLAATNAHIGQILG